MPMKGSIEIIKSLKKKGIMLAVASSAKREIIKRTLGSFSVLDYIDAIASGA